MCLSLRPSLLPPNPPQPPLPLLPRRGPIHHAIHARPSLPPRLLRAQPHPHPHDARRQHARRQYPDHDEVALAVLVLALRVGRPPGVQRVRGHDGAEVAEAGDEGGRRRDADLTVARLEDFVRPGHGERHGRAEAEADPVLRGW